MVTESTAWTQTEFEQLDLGDARQDKRARLLMERMAAEPTASVPQACHGWGETMAAYRFFDNEQVQWHAIPEPHWQQTQKRMQAHRDVRCLQDATELDFNGQEAIGPGPLTFEAQRRMFVHPTYAVTPQREPLGILDAWMWAREKKDDSGQRGGLKESFRWIEDYERLAEMASDMSSTRRLAYVADREADLMALMERADALGNPAYWLVRASHNRSLPEGDKLWERATHDEAVGEIAFPMVAHQGVKARTVHQRLWLQRVQLPAGKGKSVAATCLIAREFDAPAGVRPIEWRLLTNRAAATLDKATELIEWYRARWGIEILFNVLKNGCQVEELRLGTIDRLEHALALFLVVAWRVAHLMRMDRTCPYLHAHLFFDLDEIRAVYLLTKTPRATQPKLNEVLRLIARRGGFFARKSDGEPGVETIWKGLSHVRIAAETLRLLRDEGGDGIYV